MTYKTKKQNSFLYKGQNLKFETRQRIGRGGNGSVYKITCKPLSPEALVVKVLNPSNYKNNPYPVKKYNRFRIEVEQGKKLSDLSNCFLRIIDYHLPEVPMKNNKPWFVMPLAESFKERILKFNLTIEEKINLIIEIGNAIKILHDNGYAHRDIKLDNILIYQKRVVLCDFGLIRHISLERLTDLNEPVGPWNTIAPEMKRVASQFTVPKEADIYSFGKLIWIILTEDEHCFDGVYSRYDVMSLNYNKKIKVVGWRILHELLERTTENLPSKRPVIEEVLKMIECWKLTLKDQDLIRKENNLELYENIPQQYIPTEYIYKETIQIHEIMSKLIKEHYLYKKSLGKIGPILDIKRADIENCLMLDTKNKSYLLQPSSLKYSDNKWLLSTAEIDEKELERKGILPLESKIDILESLFDQALSKNKKSERIEIIEEQNDILLQFIL